MKKLVKAVVAVALLFVVFAAPAHAEKPAGKKLRVLLTYGGHGFQQAPFFAMFDKMEGIEYTKAPMPESADMLKPGLQKDFDVIVMYDMVGKITPEQQKALTALLNEGIAVVSMHHNLGAHRDWPEFAKIIGGKYVFKPEEIDGKQYGKSGYAHGQDMNVAIAKPDHPIVKGLKNFTIHDETYNKFYVAADVEVLLTTDHPKSDRNIAWVKDYGKSKVFYYMLGHDSKAWENENFPKILKRGILWTAGELK